MKLPRLPGCRFSQLAVVLLLLGITLMPARAQEGFRSISGYGNSHVNPSWGAAGSNLVRMVAPHYSDDRREPNGEHRPDARLVSNLVSAQWESHPSRARVSDFVWQWGQFLDHDLDLTGSAIPAEPFDIEVPIGDPFFDPAGDGEAYIRMTRSIYDHTTGRSGHRPRQQINEITAFIDGSNVYGSDIIRAMALRAFDGEGRLKTSRGGLLPFNIEGLPNAGGDHPSLFLAGDIRANEQIGLTAMHTLFVREHNRQAGRILRANPGLSGDEVYERARAHVGALLQVITYKEFLPVLLGPHALPTYRGHDPFVDAGISNMFSTAAFRFGHSMVSAMLQRLDRSGDPIAAGHLALKDAFFAPHLLTPGEGIEPLLRGLARQVAEEIDPMIVDALRNFLFGPPGAGGLDLAALNIQRGRDHGLPDYNETRIAFGLRPVRHFYEITANRDLEDRLQQAYHHPQDMDVWAAGLAEDHVDGALVGELFHKVLVDQFTRLRNGDAFWYQRVLSGRELQRLESTTLADVIRRNTRIGREIQDNVFLVDGS